MFIPESEWPKTELEYWRAIESLGAFLWNMNHDLADGRLSEENLTTRAMKKTHEVQEKLVSELFELFGVVHPKDCPKTEIGHKPPPAPLGMIWYWDWYHKMKEKFYQAEYEEMICSACPFSEGVDMFIRLGGTIPCGVFRGVMYRLSAPHLCGMIHPSMWSIKELHSGILEKSGKTALKKFVAKSRELRKKYEEGRKERLLEADRKRSK